MSDRPSSPSAWLPERFERTHELARRPLGGVARARDTATGAVVVVKTFDLRDDVDGATRRRFEREVQVLARLAHPNVVSLVAAGIEGRRAWLATEHVEGGDLGARLAPPRPRLPLGEALMMGARLADALDHAHRQGVLHRDVKPSNVLIDPVRDQVKLADFGIAALRDAARSRTGALTGSPAYMAPEVLAGGPATAAADLYALAAVLYEAIAGHPPHRAPTLGALLRAVAQAPIAPLDRVRPDVPGDVCRLVHAGLSRAAAGRPRDANRYAQDLRAAAAALRDDPPDLRGRPHRGV